MRRSISSQNRAQSARSANAGGTLSSQSSVSSQGNEYNHLIDPVLVKKLNDRQQDKEKERRDKLLLSPIVQVSEKQEKMERITSQQRSRSVNKAISPRVNTYNNNTSYILQGVSASQSPKPPHNISQSQSPQPQLQPQPLQSFSLSPMPIPTKNQLANSPMNATSPQTNSNPVFTQFTSQLQPFQYHYSDETNQQSSKDQRDLKQPIVSYQTSYQHSSIQEQIYLGLTGPGFQSRNILSPMRGNIKSSNT
ncbi:MAG: hypothetical protein EZS28_050132, partial [Streblomastix strix]